MRIAIVEDEHSCAECLHDYLRRYEQEQEVSFHVEKFTDGQQIVKRCRTGNGFDVIFMDIQMRHMDGMTAARKIRETDSDVILIYITNMAQFAIKGYEVNALDFLVKPVGYPMFEAKLKKAQNKLEAAKEKFLVGKSRDGIFKIYTKDLIYIEVKNHSLVYHTTSGEYICTGSLKETEKEIQGVAFSRCNSCYLVHLAYVEKVTKDVVVMADGSHLLISGPRKKNFMKELTDYYGGYYGTHRVF